MPIYLDNAATTPVDPIVTRAMFEWQKDNFGNPSSLHRHGQFSRIKIEEVRDKVALCLGCLSKEIVFSSGGTESNNMALIGAAQTLRQKGNHIIISGVEHPSIVSAAAYLEKIGFEISHINPNEQGSFSMDKLKDEIREDTIIVSVMYINNETGIISPVDQIGVLCKQKKILFHCDAVQAFAKVAFKINDLNIDLMPFSAHKIYGPKGIGGLFIKEGVKIEPLNFGGSQEANKRPGTENLTGIIGMGTAVELMKDSLKEWERAVLLKNMFEKGILEKIPDTLVIGSQGNRSPFISNISFPGCDNQSLLLTLDLEGLSVSVGSACSSGSIKQSHVLYSMGLKEEIISSSVRFSFGRFNTEDEISRAVNIIRKSVLKLRK